MKACWPQLPLMILACIADHFRSVSMQRGKFSPPSYTRAPPASIHRCTAHRPHPHPIRCSLTDQQPADSPTRAQGSPTSAPRLGPTRSRLARSCTRSFRGTPPAPLRDAQPSRGAIRPTESAGFPRRGWQGRGAPHGVDTIHIYSPLSLIILWGQRVVRIYEPHATLARMTCVSSESCVCVTHSSIMHSYILTHDTQLHYAFILMQFLLTCQTHATFTDLIKQDFGRS